MNKTLPDSPINKAIPRQSPQSRWSTCSLRRTSPKILAFSPISACPRPAARPRWRPRQSRRGCRIRPGRRPPSAMQEIASAPSPTCAQTERSRREPGPLRLSSSIAASASLRILPVSTVSAASMISFSTGLTASGCGCVSAHFRRARRSGLRPALMASVYFAMLPRVSFSRTSRSLTQRSIRMMRESGRSSPVA